MTLQPWNQAHKTSAAMWAQKQFAQLACLWLFELILLLLDSFFGFLDSRDVTLNICGLILIILLLLRRICAQTLQGIRYVDKLATLKMADAPYWQGGVTTLREGVALGHLTYCTSSDHILDILIHIRPKVGFRKHYKGLLFTKMVDKWITMDLMDQELSCTTICTKSRVPLNK